MQQPELGRRLTALRKQKNFTQEELAEKSNVSVRTIQRIEAGEVLPRLSTVKILLEALGENYESFSMNQSQIKVQPVANRNTLMVGALTGIVYLVSEIILGAMDVAWFMKDRDWDFKMNAVFSGLTIVMIVSYVLFARGFIALSDIFENRLLKFVAYLNIVVISVLGIFDIATLSVEDFEI